MLQRVEARLMTTRIDRDYYESENDPFIDDSEVLLRFQRFLIQKVPIDAEEIRKKCMSL